MAPNSKEYIKLAQSLPPRLTRFFARYPPPALLRRSSTPTPTPARAFSESAIASQAPPSQSELPYQNPFLPHKFAATGRWHDPVFSLRRQADLVKLARQHGVEGLLPFTTKGTEERIRKRQEQGLRIKGTGVGQKVKGKLAERQMKGKLEKRRQAMLEMPQMIATWKERGHGRGWKKWPK